VDVAWSGDRKRDPKTGQVPQVGTTVDIEKATYTNAIGATVLTGFWQDEEFDGRQRAFYYVRATEIPTPRWTAYDADQLGKFVHSGESPGLDCDSRPLLLRAVLRLSN
jgi:hypothetical protein